MTAREYYTRGGQANKIEKYAPDPEFTYLIEAFWDLKCGDIDYRIHRNDMRDTLLDRNDRAIILKMDMAFLAELAKERAKTSRAKAKK